MGYSGGTIIVIQAQPASCGYLSELLRLCLTGSPSPNPCICFLRVSQLSKAGKGNHDNKKTIIQLVKKRIKNM